jgi:hypothetical protein
MRRLLILALAACAVGCTNDYGGFRFPKGAVAVVDGSSVPAPDGGTDAAPEGG